MIFRNWVCQNFPVLVDDFDALTDYELFCKVLSYVKDIVKDNKEINKKLNELEIYVKNYFENLDVQEEIDNKLDEMVQQGTLQEIIEEYLNFKTTRCYDDIKELKESTNLIAGSTAQIIGYDSINDGGKNIYYIRERTIDDNIDDVNIVLLDSGLVAELIKKNDFIPLEAEGYYKFTGAKGNHATVWYSIISKENKPNLTLANNTLHTVQHGYENARDNLSTVTINAGIFNLSTNETIGIIIKDGVTLKPNNDPESGTEILYMLEDGTLHSVASSTSTEDIEALNPVGALNGFYPIIQTGVDLTPARDPYDFVERSFIGQNAAGDYIVGCCNGRGYYDKGMSLADIVAFCNSLNFTPYFLYNLDGGRSAELDIRGERVNKLEYYTDDRKVANFLTFKSKYARDKSIFDKSVTNTKKWILQEDILNTGENILPLLTPVNDVTILPGSSAVKRGKVTILNLILRTADTFSTYTNLLTGLPRLSQNRDALFVDLISHTDGKKYLCYIYDTENSLRTAGASSLPNGLPAGDYSLNIVYNNYF